jgi:sarcosine oxidase subunit alpha
VTGPYRLPSGGSRIDRSRPVRFRWDGRELEGFVGDTLASALLANGVRIVGHGIYSRRPRGVFSAGPEEPNALVDVVWPDGTPEPMLRATTVELVEGLAARPLAGFGRLTAPDERRYDKRHVHTDVLVVGAGTAGIDAATTAAERGDRVIVADERPAIDARVAGETTLLAGSTVTGVYDHGYAIIAVRRPGSRTSGTLWHVRAKRIVLATGAIERPLAFAGNDRPGVMLAAAARSYVEAYGVAPGRRAPSTSAPPVACTRRRAPRPPR